jgi:WD40 repeat protein
MSARLGERWIQLLCASSILALAPPTFGRDAEIGLSPIGEETATVSFHSTVESLAWSPDQKLIAAATNRHSIVRLHDFGRDHQLWEAQKVGTADESGLEFDKSGEYVIVRSSVATGQISLDTTVSLIRVADGQVSRHLSDAEPKVGSNAAKHFALSADRSALAAVLGIASGRVAIYDTDSWGLIGHIGPLANLYGLVRVAIDSSRGLVEVGLINGEIETWRIATNEQVKSFKVYDVRLASMVLNPSTGDIVTGGSPIYEQRLVSSPPPVYRKFHDDQANLVSAWDPITGDRRVIYSGPGEGVTSLAVSPNGRFIAAFKGAFS